MCDCLLVEWIAHRNMPQGSLLGHLILQERGVSSVRSHDFQPFCPIVARSYLPFSASNTHDQLNLITEPIEIVEKLQCKRKMPCVEAMAIGTLNDDVDIQIVHREPSTKRKQTPRMKVTTKTTKSKKTTSKEEHEVDEEFGVSKN